jgi:hypothetical protein
MELIPQDNPMIVTGVMSDGISTKGPSVIYCMLCPFFREPLKSPLFFREVQILKPNSFKMNFKAVVP